MFILMISRVHLLLTNLILNFKFHFNNKVLLKNRVENTVFVQSKLILKANFIKTGIVVSLAAYWGVILVGTFITFS